MPEIVNNLPELLFQTCLGKSFKVGDPKLCKAHMFTRLFLKPLASAPVTKERTLTLAKHRFSRSGGF